MTMERTERCRAHDAQVVTYLVEYLAGDSRYTPGTGVDYMRALVIESEIELYAEREQQPDDECGTYDVLKAEILEQATEHGIAHESLIFWFDQ